MLSYDAEIVFKIAFEFVDLQYSHFKSIKYELKRNLYFENWEVTCTALIHVLHIKSHRKSKINR